MSHNCDARTASRLSIEVVDTPGWHGVLVMEQRPRLDPEIICVGFKTTRQRDNWLANFGAATRNLASMLPVTLR